MTIALITLLIVISVAVVALPFVSRRARGPAEDEAAEIAHGLRRARDRVYEEIRTLQQEYFLKNVSEEEYRDQIQQARLRAADLARQQHDIQETLWAIEQAVDDEMDMALRAGDGDARSDTDTEDTLNAR